MKKFLLFLCLSVVAVMFSYGQRLMENLDRGLTAVKVSNGVFVSWRMLGSEWNNTQYNLYRNGVKLNTEPLSVSNYLDEGGSNASTYTLGLVKEGVESLNRAITRSGTNNTWKSPCARSSKTASTTAHSTN